MKKIKGGNFLHWSVIGFLGILSASLIVQMLNLEVTTQKLSTQVRELSQKIEKVSNTSEQKTNTDFSVFPDGGALYETNGEALGVVYPNNTKELLTENIWTNELRPEVCQKEQVSIFHVYHNPERILFREGCGEAGGALWSYDVQTKTLRRMKVNFVWGATPESPDGQYQVIEGKPDANNEIKNLHVIDFVNEREYDIAPLGPNETYVTGISDFDGEPYASIHWENDQVKVDVFSAKDPVVSRKPIRTVSPQYKQ